MDIEKWSLRVGTTALLFAVLVRLGSTGVIGSALELLQSPEAVSTMLFLETGRMVYAVTQKPPEQVKTEA